MPRYLVESYLVDSPDAANAAHERARSVADGEAGVHYIRTTFLPDDEVVLHLFEAPSADALAALACDRIVEVEEVVESQEET